MPEGTDLIYDVGEADFEERVLRASSERPVVVDFWAPWCAPCRMLGPLLEKAVSSFSGRMALAKLNIDGAQALATRYGIRGIPAVKVFRNGRVMAEFVGLRGESEVRQMLSRALPSEADDLAAEASELLSGGQTGEAEAIYREVIAQQPNHAGALLGLARLAMEGGDLGEARRAASAVEPGTAEYEEAERLLARLDFGEECARHGGREALERQLGSGEDDLDVCYACATCLAAEGDYERALEKFLGIVERDRKYGDGAVKDAMVRIFSIVGQRSELADEYRSRLARALY